LFLQLGGNPAIKDACSLTAQQRAIIISPASGIHRPSYNGAPARQTCKSNHRTIICQLCLLPASEPALRANVRRNDIYTARLAF
jgi:hypothetical protein